MYTPLAPLAATAWVTAEPVPYSRRRDGRELRLKPGDRWHGFEGLAENHVLVDPIKVTILTPGLSADGSMHDHGIPAAIVTKFLSARRIEIEKTGLFGTDAQLKGCLIQRHVHVIALSRFEFLLAGREKKAMQIEHQFLVRRDILNGDGSEERFLLRPGRGNAKGQQE